MHEILARLRLDHQRLGKVLRELERVANINDVSTTRSDHLFCLLDYLGGYPHQIHHPTEDLVFSALLDKVLSSEQRQAVKGNAMQHETLEEKTEVLLASVDDPDFAESDALADFLRLQKAHMEFEESVVFPIAQVVFSDADWAAIAHHQERLHDPLFDSADRRFSALFDCLGVEPEKIRARGARAVSAYLSSTRG